MSSTPQQSLAGRTAVITGASSGIGASIAISLAADGADVALLARRADRLEAVAGRIRDAGGRAVAVVADVTDEASLAAGYERIRETFGPVDILVNSAGMLRVETAEEGDLLRWAELVDCNVNGIVRSLHVFLPDLLLAGASGQAADLVNISSISADVVNPLLTAYGMSKAAVSQLSTNLRAELGPKGVRVSVIEPAVVDTELLRQASHPQYDQYMDYLMSNIQVLRPEDVAAVVRFIVSQPRHINVPQLSLYSTAQP